MSSSPAALERSRRYREKHRDRVRESQRKFYVAHKDEVSAYHKEHYTENKDKILRRRREYEQREDRKKIRKEQKKVYYLENKDKIQARNKQYQEAHKEQLSKSSKAWKEKNWDKVLFIASKARASREKRSVSWANKKKMIEIYKNCPDGMEVDHIVPLKGKFVSGLHTENNLQYLTQEDNLKKGNKFSFNEYKKTSHYKYWIKSLNKAIEKFKEKRGN